jgi:hypothetical protein
VATGVARASDSYNSTTRVLNGQGSAADILSMTGQNGTAERVRAIQSAGQGDLGGTILHSLQADAFDGQ